MVDRQTTGGSQDYEGTNVIGNTGGITVGNTLETHTQRMDKETDCIHVLEAGRDNCYLMKSAVCYNFSFVPAYC